MPRETETVAWKRFENIGWIATTMAISVVFFYNTFLTRTEASQMKADRDKYFERIEKRLDLIDARLIAIIEYQQRRQQNGR